MTEVLSPINKFHRTLLQDKTYEYQIIDFELLRPAMASIVQVLPDPPLAWIEKQDEESGTIYAITEQHVYFCPYGGDKRPKTTVLALDLTRLDVGGTPDGLELATLDVDLHLRHYPEVISIRARGNSDNRRNVAPLKDLLPALHDAVRPSPDDDDVEG